MLDYKTKRILHATSLYTVNVSAFAWLSYAEKQICLWLAQMILSPGTSSCDRSFHALWQMPMPGFISCMPLLAAAVTAANTVSPNPCGKPACSPHLPQSASDRRSCWCLLFSVVLCSLEDPFSLLTSPASTSIRQALLSVLVIQFSRALTGIPFFAAGCIWSVRRHLDARLLPSELPCMLTHVAFLPRVPKLSSYTW